MAAPRGVLLVLAGPSGVGKGTIGKALLASQPTLGWSVSWNTRPPRPGEVDGRDYHFVSHDAFVALRDAGGFLESFDVYGDLKGTPRQPVLDRIAGGGDILLEVDVQGALAIREQFPEALLVFVAPPSRAAQIARIRERGADSESAVERRLAEADAEEQLAHERFDAIVVNDEVDRAVAEVAAILETRRESLR